MWYSIMLRVLNVELEVGTDQGLPPISSRTSNAEKTSQFYLRRRTNRTTTAIPSADAIPTMR